MDEKSRILLTGGLGFIGAHTAVELLSAGYSVVVVDNLQNSNRGTVELVSQITGRRLHFEHVSIMDTTALQRVLKLHSIESVIHFAALKSVEESTRFPMRYYGLNVGGTLSILTAMEMAGVRQIVFSSSATVYGEPRVLPINEDHPKSSLNPYASTKIICEQMIDDWVNADPQRKARILRYFNPVGGHVSGLIGESPETPATNLFPIVARVALGLTEYLSIFGDDYPTADGTAVRDYVHVSDLACGHLASLKNMSSSPIANSAFNLGTGNGHSVMEVVKTYSQVNSVNIPTVIAPRRSGDTAACYADCSKARQELGWVSKMELEDMCRTAWAFAKKQYRQR